MIKIGTPLALELNNNGDISRYRCKVVEYEDNDLFIDYPINVITGRSDIFPTGTEFNASFVGNDNSVYKFNTEIVGKKNINIPTLILDYPEKDLVRIQRREYVRVDTAVDISVDDPTLKIPTITSVTNDISGGGISIVLPTSYPFESGMLLDLCMVFPMESGTFEYVLAEAEVIRVIKRREGQKDLLSLKFIAITDKDRQTIIRYCFEKQLKTRKKGLKF
ncbi:flagellar brake protein [Aquibacillus halophilus]|uniref:flagellar brake protein n=1 Tax=Aquibacillus halophilus TaxID=930132 RepID=UPI001478CC6C|nr:flagellar brake domain-containing protein [Aquibacillus halophilus]